MAYAIYALSHGVDEDAVRAAIASRDLAHKGTEKRQAEYIERTIQKAWTLFAGTPENVKREVHWTVHRSAAALGIQPDRRCSLPGSDQRQRSPIGRSAVHPEG